MNREQILSKLKELRDQFPNDIIDSNYVAVEDIARHLIKEEEKLRGLEPLNFENTEIKKVQEQIKKLELDLREMQFEFEDVNDTIVTNKSEMGSIQSGIALSEKRRYRDIQRKNIYENEEVLKEIDKRVANVEEEIKQEWKEYEELVEDNKTLNAKLNNIMQTQTNITKKLSEAYDKYNELVLEEERKRYEIAQTNAKALKSKLGFVSSGLFDELTNLINDYESGKADNNVVNYTMDRIKSTIASNKALDSFEVEEAVIIDEQLEIIDDQIEKLDRKIKNDRNYILSENQYNKLLSEKRTALRRERKNYNSQKRRFNFNESKLNDSTLELSEKNRLKIEKRNAGISSRMKEREKVIIKLENEIKKIEASHGKVDKVARKNDEKELKNLKENRNNLKYLKDIHEVSMLDKMDVLITATGGPLPNDNKKTEEQGETTVVPEVVGEELPIIKDEDKKIDKPKFILDEEKAPVIEPNNEEKGLVPVEAKEEFPPLGPTEVVGYEEPKEAVKKPNKLKKILLIAATALSLIAVGISSMIKKDKNPVVPPTPTPSVTYEMVEEEKPTLTPELDISDENPAPEDEKDNNDKPSKDKDDDKPNKDDDKPGKPTEKPDEEVEQTPEPIVVKLKPGDQKVDVIKDDDGNIIGERVTTIGDDGQVIVDETGDVEKLEDQEIIVYTDKETIDEKKEIQQDNLKIAEDEELSDQVDKDLESGKIDNIIWDKIIDGTTGEEVSEDALSSPDEVKIDNYSVKAEDTLDLNNSPFGMSQEELDALINDILNGEGKTL